MKRYLFNFIFSLLFFNSFAQLQTINNGESGLSSRQKINNIVTYLNRLSLDIEYSEDGSNWHYGWVTGDVYMRLSSDYGVTWTDAIYLLNSDPMNKLTVDTLIVGSDTIFADKYLNKSDSTLYITPHDFNTSLTLYKLKSDSTANTGYATQYDLTTGLATKQNTLTNPVTGIGTANQIAYWPTTSTVGSLTTATYPSLTELSYVKGVTSAIQTQLNGKQDIINGTGFVKANGTTLSYDNNSYLQYRTFGTAANNNTGDFILNGTSQQPNSNFNISGNGTFGGNITVGSDITASDNISIYAPNNFISLRSGNNYNYYWALNHVFGDNTTNNEFGRFTNDGLIMNNLQIQATTAKLTNLAGTGTRIVTANSAGQLGTDYNIDPSKIISLSGSTTANYLTKFTGTNRDIAVSQIYDNGTNIGIGTTNPGAKLEVNGNAQFTSYFSTYTPDGIFGESSTPIYIRTSSAYGGGVGSYIGYRDYGYGQYWGRFGVKGVTNWSFGIAEEAGNNFSIGTGNYISTDMFTITSTGNVGIWTTSPSELLHISKGASADDVTAFIENTAYEVGSNSRLLLSTKGANGNSYQASIINKQAGITAGNLVFNTVGSDRMIIDSSGNIGIGTTSPTAKLEVNGIVMAQNGDELGYRPLTTWYSWDGVSEHHYWNKLFNFAYNDGVVTFQVLVKSDLNYPDYAIYNVTASKFSGRAVSLSVDKISGTNNVDFKVAVDNNGDVWVRSKATWASFVGYKILYNDTHVSKYSAPLTYQEATPASSVAIGPSENFKAIWPSMVIIESGFQNIFMDSSNNVGIGTLTPGASLDVNGKTKTSTFQMTTGASNGYVLTSDASGNASWAAPAAGMTYPGAGIAVSTGSAWGTSIADNSANWNTAYTHSQSAHQSIINGTGFVKANGTTLSYDNNSYEPALGNPGGNGYVLSSTTSGVRTWQAMLTDAASDNNYYARRNGTWAAVPTNPWGSGTYGIQYNGYASIGSNPASNDRMLDITSSVAYGVIINHSAASGYALRSITSQSSSYAGRFTNTATSGTSIGLWAEATASASGIGASIGGGLIDVALQNSGVLGLVPRSAAPSTHASMGQVYAKSDGKVYYKNPSGTEYDLTVSGGSMTYPGAGIPISTGSAWGTSITNNSTNWNTAYSWGNHASMGYLTSISKAMVENVLTGTITTHTHNYMSNPLTTEGDLLYRDGSGASRLAKGTAGQVLKSTSTSVAWGDGSARTATYTVTGSGNTATSPLFGEAVSSTVLSSSGIITVTFTDASGTTSSLKVQSIMGAIAYNSGTPGVSSIPIYTGDAIPGTLQLQAYSNRMRVIYTSNTSSTIYVKFTILD